MKSSHYIRAETLTRSVHHLLQLTNKLRPGENERILFYKLFFLACSLGPVGSVVVLTRWNIGLIKTAATFAIYCKPCNPFGSFTYRLKETQHEVTSLSITTPFQMDGMLVHHRITQHEVTRSVTTPLWMGC